jgi:hypothetical protein
MLEATERSPHDFAEVSVAWLAIPKMRLKQLLLLDRIFLIDEPLPSLSERRGIACNDPCPTWLNPRSIVNK